MKLGTGRGLGILAWLVLAVGVADGQSATATLSAPSKDEMQMVPPAGPGVFTVKESRPGVFKLVVAGHTFTNRSDIEKYLAWRSARLTIERGGTWFTFIEDRSKGETAEPVPARDPGAPRYSFRMKYFRPVWRFKASASAEWTRWSPFSGVAFQADPQAISDFEVSADIVVRTGPMDDADPLAFEAWAVSDLLVNQVSPPK